MRISLTRFLFALLTAALIPACGGEADTTQTDLSGFDWYVSASRGSNSNAGDLSAPFKTIDKALSMAISGDSIRVLPGFYGAGEPFPLFIPAGVRLIGNEAKRGADTVILGGDILGGCLRAFDGVMIAGFTVTNNVGAFTDPVYGIEITGDNVRIRNCTFADSVQSAIPSAGSSAVLVQAGNGTKILHCLFQNNAQNGLMVDGTVTGLWVEGSEFRGNAVGVLLTTADTFVRLDANTFSSNTTFDLQLGTTIAAPVTVSAQNCFWDHAPPSGNDLQNDDPANWTVDTTGAQVAPHPSP
jgi:hypothetical protein